MTISRPEAVEFLKNSNFKGLFLELLAWNKANETRTLVCNGQSFEFEAFAQQAGVTAYACRVKDVSKLDYQTRNKIEQVAAPIFPSHLFVFFDGNWMVWQWSRRELGQPRQLRSVGPFAKTSSFEPVLQKLDVLSFDIDNGNVQATEVDSRLRDAFNVEPVTKAFYKQFEAEYKEFLAAIKGVAVGYEREFASLMLNRLMFLYFMQRKGFLLGKEDYLLDRFKDSSKRVDGKKDYLDGFLAPLFFQILSVVKEDRGGKKAEVAREYVRVFGDVIYLNGGLFSQRDWEKGGKITIPDAAFKKIFDFFGNWRWHLDERPTRAGNEINPDVLGYVFEKFINQRQMGAYYTKEDITGYISKNTILPFLFEKSGLDPQRPFRLLTENIERYIYPAVKHGCDLSLPADVEAGIKDISKRDGWNQLATPNLGLPTETWREVIARRERFQSLIGKSTKTKFESVSDLVTHNLDISQWFSDVVADISEAHELEKLWTALEEVSVLDPTVGSGAFLFAAMGVLEPVYSACLERMDGFASEADTRAGKQAFKSAPTFDVFRAALREIEGHPNRLYAIFKKLAVQNLYGVDLMPEATEICKLRLFLKLAAQVSPEKSKDNLGIEPLPDIDFNIRSGNTLVGFATEAEVKLASQTQMSFGVTWEEIEAAMQSYGDSLTQFRLAQLSGKSPSAAAKSHLQQEHDALVEKLNWFNAGLYAVMPKSDPKGYAEWKVSHQPFHWCTEFYSTMRTGGFDVIIGNPPYVEYPSPKVNYSVKGYATEICGNLYAMATERALSLLTSSKSHGGRFGFIVPVASVCTDGYIPMQSLLRSTGDLFISNYNDRPGRLFEGLEHIRLSIILNVKNGGNKIFSTKYSKWNSEVRENLFPLLKMISVSNFVTPGTIPKHSEEIEGSINKKLALQKTTIQHFESKFGDAEFYYTRKLSGFVQILGFIPKIYDSKGKLREPSELKVIKVKDVETAKVFLSLFNSSLFFWFLTTRSDCRNLNKREVFAMPLDISKMEKKQLKQLAKLSDELNKDLDAG